MSSRANHKSSSFDGQSLSEKRRRASGEVSLTVNLWKRIESPSYLMVPFGSVELCLNSLNL
jgi:hypothetical protein